MEAQGGGGGFFDFATPALDKDAFVGELEDITVDGADQLVDKDELNDETFADDLDDWVNPDERPGKTLQEVELELELSKLKVQDKLEKEAAGVLTTGGWQAGLGIFAAQPPQQQLGDAKNAAAGMPPAPGAASPMQRMDPSMLFARGGPQQMPPPGMFPGGPMPPYMPGYGPPRPPGPDGHPMSAAELEQRMRHGGPDRNQGPSPIPYGMPPYGMPMPYPPPQGHSGMGPYGPNRSPMMPHHRVPSPMQGMGMPGSPHMHMSPMMGPPMQMPPGYDNLMTRSEKDFIIRVQMSQLQTNNPQLDDYYFQAYNLKRLAQEQGSHPRLLLARSHHQARKYEPIVFENTLGRLPAGSIHAPKPLIDVAVTRQESTGPTSARRKLLMSMEAAYKQLLALEDLDNEIAVMPPQERAGPLAVRAGMIDRLYALLHVAPVSTQSVADDEQFMRFISVAKAQKLLARAMVYFSTEQSHAIVLAVMRNTLTLDQATADGKQVFEGVHSHMGPALVQVMSTFPMDVIVSIGQVFSANPSPTIVAFLKTRLGTELLQVLFARGNALIGQEKPELKRLWEAVLAKVGGALPGQSKVLFGGPRRLTSNALWLLLADVVPFVPQKWKQGVLDELRPLAQNAVANSTGATSFLQRNP